MRRHLLFAFLIPMASAAPAQDLMLFDPASFGQTLLPRQEALLGEPRLEAQVGAYNNEFISNYGPQSIFARTGRAVGRLDVLTNVGHAPCTAFLVEGNLLVTNHHCVPGILDNPQMKAQGADSIVAVQFKAGYVRDGIEDGVESFIVDPTPLETSKALDYTVLRVLGDANARFGALELSAATPLDRDPFWVIGHPMGEAQRISREKCQADSPAVASGRLRHTCDTLPGNSGSPVIDAGLQQVVALHHAGSRAGEVNFAVPMADILAQSALLKAAVSGGGDADRLRAETSAREAAEAEAKRLAEELALLRSGGGGDKDDLTDKDKDADVAVRPAPDTNRFGLAPGDLGLRIEMDGQAKGTVVIDLFEDIAPDHTTRLTELARSGAYDGVVFHRVIEGFMAQTGDVQYGSTSGRDFAVGMLGSGGSDMPDIKAEFSDIAFERGIVGMARAGDPDSANSQFFIMFEDKPFLNGQYTAIGRVIHGMDIVDRIKRWDQSGDGFNGAPDTMLQVIALD